MTIQAKCPKCEKLIAEIKAEPFPMKDGTKPLKGAVYLCPLCNTILGAGADPYALANEIALRIVKR